MINFFLENSNSKTAEIVEKLKALDFSVRDYGNLTFCEHFGATLNSILYKSLLDDSWKMIIYEGNETKLEIPLEVFGGIHSL